jgi:hypothetical protein
VNSTAEYRAKINQFDAQLDSKFQDLERRLRRGDISRKQFTRGVIIANRVMFDKVVKLRNDPSNRGHAEPFYGWSDNVQNRNDRYLDEATSDPDSIDVLVEEGISTEQEAQNLHKVLRSKRARSGLSTNTTRSASPQRPVLSWYDVYMETDPYLLVPPAPIQVWKN